MTNHLDLDRSEFRSAFGKQPFLIGHRLTHHPLFELPRLITLAQRLPARSVEYNAGDVPVSLDPARTPRNGLSPEETIRRIEQCRSWLGLRNVEQDPEYRALLEECVEEVRPLARGPLRELAGFIFVSSPGAVTPFHLDPEENFLLQIRGSKKLHLFDPSDRSLLSEAELERIYSGGHCNMVYRDAYASRGHVFEIAPGRGLHIPLTAPHWVQNGAEVSISFSVTMMTRDCYRVANLYRLNARLRRWGLRPNPIGASVLRDSMKHLLARAERRLRALA